MVNRVSSHVRRLLHQLGVPVRYGAQRFRVAGYHPVRFATPDVHHEDFLSHVLARVLKEFPGTFVDVGVNTGQTFTKVLAIDPQRPYLGFDPQLSCCFNVEQFIRLNGMTRAEVIPLALGDSNGMLSFFSDGEVDECASLVDRGSRHQSRAVSHVQCRIGDEVLQELHVASVGVIKIDVEGAESRVIRGLRGTLAHQRPALIFEVLPNFSGIGQRVRHDEEACKRNRVHAQDIVEELQRLAYRLFQLDEETGNERPVSGFDLDDVDHFGGNNYLARPIGVGD